MRLPISSKSQGHSTALVLHQLQRFKLAGGEVLAHHIHPLRYQVQDNESTTVISDMVHAHQRLPVLAFCACQVNKQRRMPSTRCSL
jgi:hypothetical protein